MTVYEKIKSLPIEDMAEFLTRDPFGCVLCEADGGDDICDFQCDEHCLHWLQKEAAD